MSMSMSVPRRSTDERPCFFFRCEDRSLSLPQGLSPLGPQRNAKNGGLGVGTLDFRARGVCERKMRAAEGILRAAVPLVSLPLDADRQIVRPHRTDGVVSTCSSHQAPSLGLGTSCRSRSV